MKKTFHSNGICQLLCKLRRDKYALRSLTQIREARSIMRLLFIPDWDIFVAFSLFQKSRMNPFVVVRRFIEDSSKLLNDERDVRGKILCESYKRKTVAKTILCCQTEKIFAKHLSLSLFLCS